MNHNYAKDKLELLLRDLSYYTADEFRRQMMRIAGGATGQDIPDDAHTIKAEHDALLIQVELFNNVRKQFNNTAMGEHEALMAMFELCCSDASNLLAEIQAKAGELGYYNGFKKALVIPQPLLPETVTSAAIDVFKYQIEQASKYAAHRYAEEIRKGDTK